MPGRICDFSWATLAPEPHSSLCSFNIQMCVGATGHNIPEKLREWHPGDRRHVGLGSAGGWPGRL